MSTAVPIGPSTRGEPAVRCDNLVHVYGAVGAEVVALRGVDLAIAEGETVGVIGPSGAGKSTLLWALAGLLRPSAGRLWLRGHQIGDLDGPALARLRGREVGVLLQNPGRNLLPYATARDNVLFAQQPSRRRARVKRHRADALLAAVGLAPAARRRAGALSGGEQQRLALAVALANGPRLLLADEPTSQLDHASAATVVDLIKAANADLGTTVLVVTHDDTVASALDRTVTIQDGRVGAEGRRGEQYVVVGRDGAIHLPPELLETMPPGTLARVRPTGDGVSLHRADPDEGGSPS